MFELTELHPCYPPDRPERKGQQCDVERYPEFSPIDRSQTRLKQSGRIWVVMIGEIGMIKRLRVEPTGNLTLLADNETAPPMTVAVEEIVPIGRVVAVIRKM